MPASWSASRRSRLSRRSPLAGVALQRQWESAAFAAGGGTYAAPGQRWAISSPAAPSTALGAVLPSYRPGVTPTDLADCLPDYAIAAIREALPAFGRQIRGFDMRRCGADRRGDAHLLADAHHRGDDFQSLNTAGCIPAGEGAGYAGGILSAAMDGIKVAEAVGWPGGVTQGDAGPPRRVPSTRSCSR